MTLRSLAFAVAACLALAAASLAIAHEPVYDAWAWLVWGRELTGLELDTSSGPSWKPLPVALTAILSLGGDTAPGLWLVVVRTAWLLGIVLSGVLAYRLAAGLGRSERIAAAAFAAIALALLADEFTMWTRQGAAGMSEPLLVALVLGAVAAALDRRSRVALALAGLAALLRPEVWPLLAAYALWRWREEPALRPWLAGVAVLVPALWLVGDLLASGGASAGARAQRGGGAPLHEGLEVLTRVAVMPLLAAWPLAALAVAGAVRGPRGRAPVAGAAWRAPDGRRDQDGAPVPGAAERAPGAGRDQDRALLVLAAGTVAWIAIVAVMAAAGFAGLPRFMAPAVAAVGILAGAGLARLIAMTARRGAAVAAAPPPHARHRGAVVPTALAIATLAIAAELPGRAAELPHALRSTARIAHAHDRLRDLVNAVGRGPLLRCGRLATSDVLVRTALAWELHVPLGDVVSFGLAPRRSGAFVVGPEATAAVRARLAERARLLGTRGEWRVYSLACPAATTRAGAATAGSGSAASAGVSGARR